MKKFEKCLKDVKEYELEEKVCVLRTLPDLLELLRCCKPEDHQSKTYSTVLSYLKEVVTFQEEHDEEVHEPARNDEGAGKSQALQEKERHLSEVE